MLILSEIGKSFKLLGNLLDASNDVAEAAKLHAVGFKKQARRDARRAEVQAAIALEIEAELKEDEAFQEQLHRRRLEQAKADAFNSIDDSEFKSPKSTTRKSVRPRQRRGPTISHEDF